MFHYTRSQNDIKLRNKTKSKRIILRRGGNRWTMGEILKNWFIVLARGYLDKSGWDASEHFVRSNSRLERTLPIMLSFLSSFVP